jgi:cytosine/uracil/thiamine/allantoin permease
LYDYAWFVGFAVSGITYVLVTRATPAPEIVEGEAALRGGELGD